MCCIYNSVATAEKKNTITNQKPFVYFLLFALILVYSFLMKYLQRTKLLFISLFDQHFKFTTIFNNPPLFFTSSPSLVCHSTGSMSLAISNGLLNHVYHSPSTHFTDNSSA